MKEQRWQELVRRLEPQARANPTAYRRKVVLLALLGYAFIGGLVLALFALAVLTVVIALASSAVLLKLLIPIGVLIFVVARALYVKFEPPDGVPLSRRQAPDLFRMVDEVRQRIQGPRVHEIRLDGETNASVVQVPRLGGLFGSRNYLVLGLPFFGALNADEFRAVVAHELGHLSRAHGRFGAFVYRVRMTWIRLLEGFEARRSIWTGFVRRFFLWYVPYFDAYTFPVTRAHEFEADDAAADAAGRDAAGAGLVKVVLAARWADETYWPGVYRQTLELPAPPQSAYAPLLAGIGEAPGADGADGWFRRVLEAETDPWDTHPSLAERLSHLGLDPHEALGLARRGTGPTAAEAYLGAAEPELVALVDRVWRSTVSSEWAERHSDAAKARAELAQLEASDALEPDAALQRAYLTETFHGRDAALARFRELLGGQNDPVARYAIGRLLLDADDDEGLQWLGEAMDRDPDAVLPGTQLAYEYLRAHDRDDEAEAYRARAEQQAEVYERASEERSEVSVDDRLEPADVPGDVLDTLREQMARHAEVAEAYLVRKRTEHLDETHPFFVLAVVPKSTLRTIWKESDDDAIPLEDRVALDVSLPGSFMVAKVVKKSPLAERFASVEGARVYARN